MTADQWVAFEQEALDVDHPEAWRSYLNIGNVYSMKMDRQVLALANFEKALGIQLELLGPRTLGSGEDLYCY